MADQGHKADLLWASEARLELLGPVRLCSLGDDDLTPKARKTRALLALLALSKSPVPRARITDLLWGDRGEEQAKASLRQALYELRSLASRGYLTADRQSISLGPKKLRTDVAQLQRLIEAGQADELAEALETVECPPLADLDDITPELDEWLRDERTRLCGAIGSGALSTAEQALTGGNPAAARRIADQLERIDPLDEKVAQIGIRADVALGDRAAAARRFARLSSRFKDQLGIEPAPETQALLKNGTVAEKPASLAAAPTAPAVASAARDNWRRFTPLILLLLAAAAALIFFLARPAAVQATPTIAVLPFEEVGGKQDGYFASGVSDEILNLLAHQKHMRVLGRISAAEIEQQPNSIEIARSLGLTHLVDGSVRTEGDRVMVIVRLTRVADGAQMWSERYERQLGDIFKVQQDIASAVTGRLTSAFGASRRQETTPDVYDRYLAARQLVRERRVVTLQEAERLLREAIARDPRYAPAYAELSQVIMLLADHPTSYGAIPLSQARQEASTHARKAIALDPNLGEAYAALGFLTLSDAKSEPLYRKAVQLEPQRPEFHRWLAQSLNENKKYEEAIAEYKRAVAIDPLWGLNYEHLCGALHLLGRDAEAARYAQHYMRLSTDPRGKLQFQTFWANQQRQPAQELAAARKLFEAYPNERQSRFKLASTLGLLGERRQAADLMKDDPLAHAVLRGDWKAMGATARNMGADYWRYGRGFWNLDALLIQTGQSRAIADLYDQARPLRASGEIPLDRFVNITTSLALRENGRAREAQALWDRGQQLDAQLPNSGKFREERQFTEALTLAHRGNTGPLLALLDRRSRDNPFYLAQLPAMSLRYYPLYRPVVRDPRFEAIDERVRAATNRERQKAGMAPISRAAWISDPKTLLTKN